MEKPRPKMSGWKANSSYGFAVIFDSLKLIFTFLVFSGPFLAQQAAQYYAAYNSYPSWAVSLAGWAAAGVVGGTELAAPPVAAAVESFGLLMAIIIGFTGGLFMALWFWVVCGLSPWHKSGTNLLWVALGWLIGMVPFLNMFFPQTFATVGIVASARKADKEALREWEAGEARAKEQQRAEQQAYINAQAERVEEAAGTI